MAEIKEEFIVLDVFSNYKVTELGTDETKIMNLQEAKRVAKEEAQIGKILDIGNTTLFLVNNIKDSLDSLLNVTFDLMQQEEIKYLEEFGVCLDRVINSFIYNPKPLNEMKGEFVVYDKLMDFVVSDEDGKFIIHSYEELEEYNNLAFVDISKNVCENLSEAIDRFETLSDCIEIILLPEEKMLLENINNSLYKLAEIYS